jgi:hypothetical protein
MLACAGVEESPPSAADGLNWEALTRRLISDGLAPLAYRRFKEHARLLPSHVFDALKRNYYQTASANHIRLAELGRLGSVLAGANIRLLVLKGGALATTVYPDPALRFMGDLDIAAPPESARAAVSLLQVEGYTLHGDLGDLDNPALLREKGWHLRLTRSIHGKEMEVEFHWPMRRKVLVNQVATLDVQGIWSRAIPLDEANNLWQPAPTDMLLHLCLHTGLQHRFTDLGLRHYVDLDRVIRCHGASAEFWAEFSYRAKQAGARDVSCFCLIWARRLLNTPIPAGASAVLEPPTWKRRSFATRIERADIVNRKDVLYDHRRIWWRLLTTDHLMRMVVAPTRSLFPGWEYLASYYGVETRWRLAGYALWYPFHALGRALRRRLELRRKQMQRPSIPGQSV